MPTLFTVAPYRQLQPEDRVSIASLRQQNLGIRAVARQLQRLPSTTRRELQRNSRPEGYGQRRCAVLATSPPQPACAQALQVGSCCSAWSATSSATASAPCPWERCAKAVGLPPGSARRHRRRNQWQAVQRSGRTIPCRRLPRAAHQQPSAFHPGSLKPKVLRLRFESALFLEATRMVSFQAVMQSVRINGDAYDSFFCWGSRVSNDRRGPQPAPSFT